VEHRGLPVAVLDRKNDDDDDDDDDEWWWATTMNRFS